MKILLTGANGLLGNCFARTILQNNHNLTRCGHNDLSKDAIRVDITDYESIDSALTNNNYTHIINCAADRDPESCLNSPVRAYTINAAGVENLAQAANKFDLTLCHISTDYVFDGKNPPYKENDSTYPLNAYGRSKLAGELAAQTAKKHLVLRIPALFRTDTKDTKNIAYKIDQELSRGNSVELDNTASRFYTQADEVAEVGVMLLEKEIQGIVHLSAEERTTKAEFGKIYARSKGYDESLVHNQDVPPPSTELRPEDSHLATNYYKTLINFEFSGPTEAFAKKN